jgi:hypothetical protein
MCHEPRLLPPPGKPWPRSLRQTQDGSAAGPRPRADSSRPRQYQAPGHGTCPVKVDECRAVFAGRSGNASNRRDAFGTGAFDVLGRSHVITFVRRRRIVGRGQRGASRQPGRPVVIAARGQLLACPGPWTHTHTHSERPSARSSPLKVLCSPASLSRVCSRASAM